jgi:uncharacterized protein (DUF1015 family)
VIENIVPEISGFRATRYAPGAELASVTAPPYDVIAPDERDRLAQLHPNNIVQLTLNKELDGDTPENNRYTRAAQTFRDWRSSGVLVTDDSERMFLYRLDFEADGQAQSIAGIVAALILEELGSGGVYGHERTIPGPKADRLSLMRATGANLEPLWFFASKTIPDFRQIVEELSAQEPVADMKDPQGIRHRVWSLSKEREARLSNEVEKIPLVVADGHHRYETSLTYRDERREADGPGPWDATLAMITDPVEYAPTVHPIHRLVKDLPLSEIPNLQPFEGSFEDLCAHVEASGPGTIGVANKNGLGTIRASGDIDTVWLAEKIIEPPNRPVRYEHDMRIVTERLAQKGETVFVMAATPVELVAKKALEGVRLPPKTTLFSPKPRSGLLLRSFD